MTAMTQTAAPTTPPPAMPDYTAIKTKQNAAWASGDYAKVGTTLQIVGEQLAEAMDPAPDARVLDVAAGNGNATLAFARRWCQVTSTDYVDTLLARSRGRAEAEALDVEFRTADAENLPFGDDSYDAVVSTFGVMLTPNQEKAASELVRVCRPGCVIGLANWTPESFVGHLFKAIGKNMAPPPGVKSPALWGDRIWIDETFGNETRSADFKTRNFVFHYRSPTHFVEFFRTYYGPVHKAFLSLDDEGKAALDADLHAVANRFNTARDGSLRAPSEYAEIVMTKI